ncbi:MAG: 50S ribosomal protein L5 [Candidatus Omnitrophica bacterium]|nr:50S ribosomal protein L5 [Candidatus Omnitrophota bacterium]MBU4477503.1 50S ribosomal protein L5 [Candidatus Omnitrophota bacterium]MCG2702901.1 50S ribosomal protein L5 [Candidatus Omnitrophota bacterium]
MIPRLLEKYRNVVVPEMIERFKFKSRMEAPRLEKIVINMGIGKASEDIKILEAVVQDLALISGQKPVITRAKKAIANFKIRKGMPVGCKVTLRKERMYEFFDRLINITLPRIRDFRGVSPNAFDGQGNYTLGISEQSIFPEIEIDKVKHVQGMDIVIVIKAKNTEQSRELLRLFGMPFRS